MSRPAYTVLVTTPHQQIRYDWVTKAEVDRKGDLRLYQGWWKQRAFHPDGEWVMYSVGVTRLARRDSDADKGDDDGHAEHGMDGPG